MTSDDRLTRQALCSRNTARTLVATLRHFIQGQFLTVMARANARTSFQPTATIAGSSLRRLSTGEWWAALSRLEDKIPVSGVAVGPLLISQYQGRPLLWQQPGEPCHWRDFAEMQKDLAVLRPVALRYRAGMAELRHRLTQTRCVEDWCELSQARLILVREVVSEVVRWAADGVGAAPPTLFLVGSATCGLGLVSDVDFLPLWSGKDGHGPAGQEILERLTTGLNACDVRADNLVARWSNHEQTAVSLQNWREELAGHPRPLELVCTLAITSRAEVIGEHDLASALVTALAAGAWHPPLSRWRRRWLAWWADLDGKIRATPEESQVRLASLHLRRLTVLREIVDFACEGQYSFDPVLLRCCLAWYRDVASLRAEAPLALACERWEGLVAELDRLGRDLLRAVGLGWWRGRSALALARWLFPHSTAPRTTEPLVLLDPYRFAPSLLVPAVPG